jgi:DNA-binding transcriptional LysR family regulator
VNIHHLELFYYVARSGGISRAVQRMPYGIQQPALSSQILLLEEDVGTKLFERSPFRLTPKGEELYAFVRPFFENLATVGARLRKESVPSIRIGASEFVLREHLPAVIERLRAQHPQIHLSLRSGYDPELLAWVLDRQIDLALTAMETRPQPVIRCLRLMRLPLVLLVSRRSKIKSATELWAHKLVKEPLISLPSFEPITRVFQKGLQRLKVEWPTAIEASSMDMVTWYVANGDGIGLSVQFALAEKPAGVRMLPLEGFAPLEVAAFWRGAPTPLIRAIIEEGQRYVRENWPQWQCDDTLN